MEPQLHATTSSAARSPERRASAYAGWCDAVTSLRRELKPIHTTEPQTRASAAPTDAAPAVRRNPPRAARAQKRHRSPDVAKENRKRRRGDDAPPLKTTVSRPSSGPRRKRTRRMAAEVHKMRCEAEDARRLVVETHEAITLATASVKNLVQDIDTISVYRPTTSSHKEASRNDTANPTPNHTGGDAPSQDLRPGQSVNKEPLDIEAAIAAFKQTQLVGSTNICRSYSATDRRALVKALSALGIIDGCTCRPTPDQQRRINRTTTLFLRPRPRIGVDAQGVPFQDWSDYPIEKDDNPNKIRWIKRESIIERHLYDDNNNHNINHSLEPTRPVALYPRRRRTFAKQPEIQFRHIPPHILDTLEAWHLELGRCGDCIVRAMRSFPLWIVGVKSTLPEGYEYGAPIFVNAGKNEIIEWDDDIRSWRHSVLDNYRWIPAEELEVRPSDRAADPNIVNGTVKVPIPLPGWIPSEG
ncbi:hypothetical protein PUNSTDRAFT_138599 [Punctularia strigosozonata HHB-11173 SS5]|uniref:Uncharacterized protein n=1 Tax=Punctularia strigosozonata (strain HHB-11173) TaxID=741275 RepID=R7S2D0_PUNST|nr:uncharacterized protein PUNSTDRAFT_138599 [Punctularia strigosozonata HHB-11173 SS5]EIN04555.1 hypothetical protein PUNSTDRAFT_138599 [Punctularia strigosozonata HHB-11173 SS5]